MGSQDPRTDGGWVVIPSRYGLRRGAINRTLSTSSLVTTYYFSLGDKGERRVGDKGIDFVRVTRNFRTDRDCGLGLSRDRVGAVGRGPFPPPFRVTREFIASGIHDGGVTSCPSQVGTVGGSLRRRNSLLIEWGQSTDVLFDPNLSSSVRNEVLVYHFKPR